jgi:hypothetical protein
MDTNGKMSQARLAALALAIGLTSCHGNNQNNEQTAAQNQDPAAVNQAAAGDQTASSNQTAASIETAPEQAPAPAESQPESSNYSGPNSSPQYTEQTAQELPSRRRRCPSTTSPRVPTPTISGLPGTGLGARPATTGYRVPGWQRLTRAPCGRRVIGATGTLGTFGILAIGDLISDSTAVSIMDSDTSAPASWAAFGATTDFTTTALPPTSTRLPSPTFTTIG